jgi:hypothetical protein
MMDKAGVIWHFGKEVAERLELEWDWERLRRADTIAIGKPYGIKEAAPKAPADVVDIPLHRLETWARREPTAEEVQEDSKWLDFVQRNYPDLCQNYHPPKEEPPMLLALQKVQTASYMNAAGYFKDDDPVFVGSLRQLLNAYLDGKRQEESYYNDSLLLVEVEPVRPKSQYRVLRTVAG